MTWKEASGAAGTELLEIAAEQANALQHSEDSALTEDAMRKLCRALNVDPTQLTPAQMDFFKCYLNAHKAVPSPPSMFEIPYEHRVPNVKF